MGVVLENAALGDGDWGAAGIFNFFGMRRGGVVRDQLVEELVGEKEVPNL